MNKKKNIKNHIPSVIVILIFLYTLPAKFIRWEEIQEIFMSTGQAFGQIGERFGSIWWIFWELWIYTIAALELLTIIFLIAGIWNMRLKFYGAILATIVLIGALFAHLFTPLWINVAWDNGLLFIMALIASVATGCILKKTYKVLFLK